MRSTKPAGMPSGGYPHLHDEQSPSSSPFLLHDGCCSCSAVVRISDEFRGRRRRRAPNGDDVSAHCLFVCVVSLDGCRHLVTRDDHAYTRNDSLRQARLASEISALPASFVSIFLLSVIGVRVVL